MLLKSTARCLKHPCRSILFHPRPPSGPKLESWSPPSSYAPPITKQRVPRYPDVTFTSTCLLSPDPHPTSPADPARAQEWTHPDNCGERAGQDRDLASFVVGLEGNNSTFLFSDPRQLHPTRHAIGTVLPLHLSRGGSFGVRRTGTMSVRRVTGESMVSWQPTD